MSRKFEAALDDSLNLLRTGASVADCLARYPEHAEELQPILSMASAVKAIPTPRPDPVAVHANRQRMLDAVQNAAAYRRRQLPVPLAWILGSPGSRGGIQPLLRTAVSMAVLIVLLGLATGGLFTAAAGSLPGQALYPVKRFGENARLSLTLNAAARQELQAEYRLERLNEVRQILDAGQRAVLEFRAELEEVGDNYWIVGGLKVLLDGSTLIEGHITLGAMVIVRASSPGDGSLQALELQVLSNPLLLTPVITSTATPTATQTPSSTPTPTPTATPTPSTVPTSTSTTTPTMSPIPTETLAPLPTSTSAPTHTREPEPTDSPEDSETEEPESTDDPDPAHTEEPEPTDTPEEDESDQPDSPDNPNSTLAEDSECSDCPETTKPGVPDSAEVAATMAQPAATAIPESSPGN